MLNLNKSFILLGSNLGDRECLISEAVEQICKKCGNLIKKSSLYESEPWGFEADNLFLNQVILVETSMSAYDLLKELLSIEIRLGRDRINKYDGYVSRPIDIDILYYNDLVVDSADLILPHPRLHQRRFTLLPLCEIASDYIHPIVKCSNMELLSRCDDMSIVRLYK